MPGNLIPAEPTLVMPMGLMTRFEETLFLDAFVDTYADSNSTRRALAFNNRHIFRLARKLSFEELLELRDFYLVVARYGNPFWFYNLRETEPPGTWDPTGGDPIGRYTVVWHGGFNETFVLGQRQLLNDFELWEVV